MHVVENMLIWRLVWSRGFQLAEGFLAGWCCSRLFVTGKGNKGEIDLRWQRVGMTSGARSVVFCHRREWFVIDQSGRHQWRVVGRAERESRREGRLVLLHEDVRLINHQQIVKKFTLVKFFNKIEILLLSSILQTPSQSSGQKLNISSNPSCPAAHRPPGF